MMMVVQFVERAVALARERRVGSWQEERKLAVELERVSTTHLHIIPLMLQWR